MGRRVESKGKKFKRVRCKVYSRSSSGNFLVVWSLFGDMERILYCKLEDLDLDFGNVI